MCESIVFLRSNAAREIERARARVCVPVCVRARARARAAAHSLILYFMNKQFERTRVHIVIHSYTYITLTYIRYMT